MRERMLEICQLSSTSLDCVYSLMLVVIKVRISDPAWGSRNNWAKIGILIGGAGAVFGGGNVGY